MLNDRNKLSAIDEARRKLLHETIQDFYSINGLHDPIDNLLDHVQNLFNVSHLEDDTVEIDKATGKPLRLYQRCTEDYLSNKIYTTFSVIRFLVKLKEEFDNSPDNPENINC